MESKFKIIMESDEVPENYKYYWGYQFNLGQDSIVPYLKRYGAFNSDISAMEIGSAEGGVLHTFLLNGAKEAVGTDIAQNRLDMGKTISELLNINVDYHYHNIINEEIPNQWLNKFDLVLLRDVIEHLENPTLALEKIKSIIKPGGFLFVTFPPYYSPYGGHQHTVYSKGGKLPYIHLLPNLIFYKLISKGSQSDIGEVKRLQKIRLTIKKFELSVLKSGFKVHKKDFYLLRPVFKMKFGLPSIKLTQISFIPLLKNFFTLEASYILRK